MEIKPFYSGRMAYDITADNGEKYVFVPKEFAEKGFVQDGLQWYEPELLKKGAFDKASLFTLPDSSVISDQAKALYQDPTQGYIWKAEDFKPINSDDFTFQNYVITDKYPAIEGLSRVKNEYNDQLVYKVPTKEGWQQSYIWGQDDTGTRFRNVKVEQGRSALGKVFGGLGDTVANFVNEGIGAINSLGPIGTMALSAISPTAAAAIAGANTGQAVGSGQADLGDVAKSAAAAYAGSQLGSSVGAEYGQAAGQVAGGTTSGLLQGRDLETSLGNAAISTGAYQAAGAGLNALNQPSSSSVNYGYEGNTGGLGLKANMGAFDPANPYSLNATNTGGLGFFASLAGLDPSNLYNLSSNFGNLDSMGGGTGIQVPLQEGATLGSIGAEVEASSSNATQNLLGKLLSSALIGSTGTGNNMATTPSNTAALGSLLGGLLGGAGNLMQGSTNVAAREKMAAELRAAGQQAAQASQFRPVGTTTRFGSSNFQVDPTTGQLTSAGYTATPLAQGYQDQLAGMTSQGLLQGQQIQGLANQYLGESPEAVRQRYVEQQNALLAPGNEQALAGIRNNLFQTGRTGLATGATSAGGLAATNPEMAAYYNSLANQQRQIAAGADVAAQNQIKFGQQLGAAAYDPFAAGFGAQAAVEKQAMLPLGLSTDLAAQFQKANAQGGAFNLNAATAASQAMLPANQYNPYASLLSGASGSNQLTGALGSLFGNTSVGSTVGKWLGSLGGYDMSALNQAASDWMSQNRDITPESTISGATDTSWIDNYLAEEQRRRNFE